MRLTPIHRIAIRNILHNRYSKLRPSSNCKKTSLRWFTLESLLMYNTKQDIVWLIFSSKLFAVLLVNENRKRSMYGLRWLLWFSFENSESNRCHSYWFSALKTSCTSIKPLFPLLQNEVRMKPSVRWARSINIMANSGYKIEILHLRMSDMPCDHILICRVFPWAIRI